MLNCKACPYQGNQYNQIIPKIKYSSFPSLIYPKYQNYPEFKSFIKNFAINQGFKEDLKPITQDKAKSGELSMKQGFKPV